MQQAVVIPLKSLSAFTGGKTSPISRVHFRTNRVRSFDCEFPIVV